MTSVDSVPSEQGRAPLRLAVFEVSGEGRKAIARIEITPKLDGTCNLAISSEVADAATHLRQIIEHTPPEESAQNLTDDSPEEMAVERAHAKLEKILSNAGYQVEVLPAGDQRLSFVIDMRTGNVVGTNEPLHDAVSSDSDSIGRRIFESISAKFRDGQNELAEKTFAATSVGAHTDAIKLVCEAYESGNAGLPPTEKLLNGLMSIDLAFASKDQRRLVQEWRIHAGTALGLCEVIAGDAEEFLAEHESTLTAEQICDLRMVIATGAMQRGNKETAIMMWRELLSEPRKLGAGNRGWAWRNISYALPVDDPEALEAARYSSDAFLEAGDKTEACKSLMQAANCLLHVEPAKALLVIDEILPLVSGDLLTHRPVKAATLHARANRLMKLGRNREALIDAQAAVRTWQGIMGVEMHLVTSLYLAASAAQAVGDDSSHQRFTEEANELARTIDIPRFSLQRRLEGLQDAFNEADALQLASDAEREGEHEIVALVRYLCATYDETLSDTRRLMLLEDALRTLEDARSDSSTVVSLQCAIANQLMAMSQPKRARTWYEKALKSDPLDRAARDGLVNCLWKSEAWGDAAVFLKSELTRRGDMPGLLYAYGRSLFEAGDLAGAFRALKKSEELADPTSNTKSLSRSLAERAFALAGTIEPVKHEDELIPARVTIEELRAALKHFASFVASVKRMEFWTRDDRSRYDWIEKPERFAQTMLHTFLKARFLERIDVFEEIAAGAGRLDIYVQLYGGLGSVVELKMCGFRYSSSYASAGEEQIAHYMGNRRSSIGYLVVFDARLENFAEPLSAEPRQDSLTIETVFVDVRPRVTKRRKM